MLPSDLDRSLRFYRDVLGLAVYREFGPPDHPGHARLATAGLSSWRFPPITLSAVTRGRLDHRGNDRYATDAGATFAWLFSKACGRGQPGRRWRPESP